MDPEDSLTTSDAELQNIIQPMVTEQLSGLMVAQSVSSGLIPSAEQMKL